MNLGSGSGYSSDGSTSLETDRSSPRWLLLRFVVALVPLVTSQVMRLHQEQAAGWLLWDYAGRIAALAVLAAAPSARLAAFQTGERRVSLSEIGLWIVGILLLQRLSQWPRRLVNAAYPATILGHYPHATGWLNEFDLVLGLALVAVSEEIIFRQYLSRALKPFLGDGILAVLATSILFGAYHWWVGLGNVLDATVSGALFMLMLRRCGVLWPVCLAHYLMDLVAFA
jgi:CAAX protease family protein